MPKRRRRRRSGRSGSGTPGSPGSMTVGAEFFALLNARDKALESVHKLKSEGKAMIESREAALTRALAAEAAHGVTPDRFVQALRQLEKLSQQQQEQILALAEFHRRFDQLLKSIREEHRTEVEAALTERIAELEVQKKRPGAPVETIEAEIARLKKELGTGRTPSTAKSVSKKMRPDPS